ncbi:MAG: hypothetical protein LBT46_15220 [Planctomycetaceae bacterium]|jgi:hypothetical protein|nr:hypothetical protein [Planctomycetaceae bacterium]
MNIFTKLAGVFGRPQVHHQEILVQEKEIPIPEHLMPENEFGYPHAACHYIGYVRHSQLTKDENNGCCFAVTPVDENGCPQSQHRYKNSKKISPYCSSVVWTDSPIPVYNAAKYLRKESDIWLVGDYYPNYFCPIIWGSVVFKEDVDAAINGTLPFDKNWHSRFTKTKPDTCVRFKFVENEFELEDALAAYRNQ